MRKYKNEEVFKDNSFYPRKDIKKRIISDNLLEYKCVECNNIGVHNNKKLVLQLDHINGRSEDNRLENLRFLCPNCHSQTETYAGKSTVGKRSKKIKIKYHDIKSENDKILFENLKNNIHDMNYIKPGTWGWKSRMCKYLGITSQKVIPWLKRVDPEFLKLYEN